MIPAPFRILLLLAAFALPLPAQAATILRDAELELSLQKILAPVLRSAGMGSDRIRVLVLKDSSLNAFVVDSRHIFIHSGLILKLNRPEALQAVLAHELAHIANGHLIQRATNAQAAGRISAISMALAVAAAASGQGEAAVVLGTGPTSSAIRTFLSHTRAQETSADQSALRYLSRAGIDPGAMADVFDLFIGQETLQPGRRDPYALTHPLSRDRQRQAKGYAAGLKTAVKPTPPATLYWFNRMNAKLEGFLRNSRYVLRRREAKGNNETAILRRAIAYHQMPNRKKALAEVNTLLKKRPNDPFYNELKGQILLESGDARGAVGAYKQAVALAPNEALLQAGLGRALLAVGSPATNKQALAVLSRAHANDPGDPNMLRNLAVAYAKNGQNGMASVTTAERYAVIGRFADATLHAKRASDVLPRGSSGWLRAQDVLRVAEGK